MRYLAFGEVMMRLMVPDYYLLGQSDELKYMFTGTGFNVMAGLSQLGHQTSILTQLPNNAIGDAAIAQLRKFNINTQWIMQNHQHIGMYFLEQGFGQRPSQVTYMNREVGAFCLIEPSQIDYDLILKDIDIVHLCGISLAISENTQKVTYELAKKAKELGKKIVFDCNYRPSLWQNKKENPKLVYEAILSLSDIVFASSKDAIELLKIEAKNEEEALFKMIEKFSLDAIIGTKRTIHNDQNMIEGFIYRQGSKVVSSKYKLDILDRIGAGDGFASGALHQLTLMKDDHELIEYATASGVLAHTTYGDIPILNDKLIKKIVNQEHYEVIR